MIEEYLQVLWASKRIPSFGLQTTNGDSIEICSFGNWNKRNAGPDFQLAKIRFDNAVIVGPIEIHIRSSDWYRHQHQKDLKYNNVILHVVYEYDQPVIINGYELPTIEIKPYIDSQHYLNYLKKRNSSVSLLCSKSIGEMQSLQIDIMKQKALEEKWMDKLERVNYTSCDRIELLYKLLALSFGLKQNQEGFLALGENVKYDDIKGLTIHQLQHLFIAESGIYLSESNTTWNFMGVHHAGNPIKRVKQFAQFIHAMSLDYIVQCTVKERGANLSQLLDRNQIGLTPFMKNQIVINAFIPFSFGMYLITEEIDWYNHIHSCLRSIKAENYAALDKWKNAGFQLDSSYDSQGFLALDKYYCSRKKCLTCSVGIQLLGR